MDELLAFINEELNNLGKRERFVDSNSALYRAGRIDALCFVKGLIKGSTR